MEIRKMVKTEVCQCGKCTYRKICKYQKEFLQSIFDIFNSSGWVNNQFNDIKNNLPEFACIEIKCSYYEEDKNML